MKQASLFRILCMIAFCLCSLSACTPEKLPYKTDPRGQRMVRSLHETDPNGTWGDYYFYYYTKGSLTRIENTTWRIVFPDTIREYRRIEIDRENIAEYRGNETEPTAGATLKDGKIMRSFTYSGGQRYDCTFHYNPAGRLDSISGSHRVLFRWDDKYPSAYSVLGGRFIPVGYGTEKNRCNMNLTDDLIGLDDNLFFYGWEIFAGLKADLLIEEGPVKYRGGRERSRYEYTNDGYECPVLIKERLEGEVIAYYTVTYYQ